MARAPRGANGPVSGKVGSVVYYIVDGEGFVRSAPGKRKRKKKTQKEKSNTGGFAKVQAFMKPLKAYLKVGLKGYGSKKGGYHAAVSYALKNAVEGNADDRFVNPEKVRVCGGELHFPGSAEVALEAGNFLRFTWSTENGENGNAYDQVFMLAYAPSVNPEKSGKHVGQATGSFRKDDTDGLQLFQEKKPVDYHVYIGFVARDRSAQSDSVYLGMVTLPAKS